MENIRRICHPIVDLSKFTFNKKILSKLCPYFKVIMKITSWLALRIKDKKETTTTTKKQTNKK